MPPPSSSLFSPFPSLFPYKSPPPPNSILLPLSSSPTPLTFQVRHLLSPFTLHRQITGHLASPSAFPAPPCLSHRPFCPLGSCISCFPLDMSILPPNTCLAEQMSNIASVSIIQPSNAGLPYGMFVGTGDCSEFAQIPAVNTCFDINFGRPATDIAIN
ncbi:hypothetical protein NUW54_g4533 [Trametes sanguinea]|uniref:Uncharacterized protein n=1 Tax=Trametes sanguinea TaxID=158606 RepID=A0ACC1PZB8_9APHY|nr:hypothetical protein NUW54_g4533 [Trametes sanguinea]